MEPVDPNRQVVIGQEGILSSREELSNFEKLAILARQRGNATGTDISEEFRAEVRLHSVLKHRVFQEIVKRYKPQIVIDVYGGSILYVGESYGTIPEKNVEVGTAGRVLSLLSPSLEKYIINDRRYDSPNLVLLNTDLVLRTIVSFVLAAGSLFGISSQVGPCIL